MNILTHINTPREGRSRADLRAYGISTCAALLWLRSPLAEVGFPYREQCNIMVKSMNLGSPTA